MHAPPAFVRQSQFYAAVARVAQILAPDVVGISPTLGNDWSGEPTVFFMVILADSATQRDGLLRITNNASETIVREVQPLEQWGVLPYFNFRGQSELSKLSEPVLA